MTYNVFSGTLNPTHFTSVCRSVTLVSPAKTAELIEMLFGLGTQVGSGNHMGVQIPPLEWEILRGERGVPL